ncbi:MAG TPA: hypothetical protein VM370_02890 [Candidatus Thermoplasmatota archaeon]|nr:hypothetical protein [Candidatus Thermoplasmatota archaeon]
MHDRDRIAREKPVGPFAPPTPSEAEDDEVGEPMAVAGDKQGSETDESFVPTTASKDQYAPDVAERYKQVPGAARGGAGVTESRKENRAAEKPAEYSEPDERGWVKPQGEGDDANGA